MTDAGRSRAQWVCVCGYMNAGPICTHCGTTLDLVQQYADMRRHKPGADDASSQTVPRA